MNEVKNGIIKKHTLTQLTYGTNYENRKQSIAEFSWKTAKITSIHWEMPVNIRRFRAHLIRRGNI